MGVLVSGDHLSRGNARLRCVQALHATPLPFVDLPSFAQCKTGHWEASSPRDFQVLLNHSTQTKYDPLPRTIAWLPALNFLQDRLHFNECWTPRPPQPPAILLLCPMETGGWNSSYRWPGTHHRQMEPQRLTGGQVPTTGRYHRVFQVPRHLPPPDGTSKEIRVDPHEHVGPSMVALEKQIFAVQATGQILRFLIHFIK